MEMQCLFSIKPILIQCRGDVIAKQSEIQWAMIWWMLFWSHSLGGKTKWGVFIVYSDVAYKLKTQAKNLNCHGQVCTCFTFLSLKNSQTNKREYCMRSDRTKIDCSFAVTGTWYVSPSLISMDERRQHRKTHMDAQRREQAQTKAGEHAQDSGSSSKHALRMSLL